jgi:hypothetical protein
MNGQVLGKLKQPYNSGEYPALEKDVNQKNREFGKLFGKIPVSGYLNISASGW